MLIPVIYFEHTISKPITTFGRIMLPPGRTALAAFSSALCLVRSKSLGCPPHDAKTISAFQRYKPEHVIYNFPTSRMGLSCIALHIQLGVFRRQEPHLQ